MPSDSTALETGATGWDAFLLAAIILAAIVLVRWLANRFGWKATNPDEPPII